MRKETAKQYLTRMNKNYPGSAKIIGVKTGTVLWYDDRDHQGVIVDSDKNEYLFSKGVDGHIGVSTPSGLKTGDVKAGETVKFYAVSTADNSIALAFEIEKTSK